MPDGDCPLPNQECQVSAADTTPAPGGGTAGNVCGCRLPFVNDGSGACVNGLGMDHFIKSVFNIQWNLI